MTRLQAILHIILRLHAWEDRHEDWTNWKIRSDIIAEAIDRASQTNEEAAVLIELGRHESQFAKRIHFGEISKHRGRHYCGFWQIDEADPFWHQFLICGYEPERTRANAKTALDIYHRHREHGTLVDGLRGYGGYHRWSLAPRLMARRAKTYEREIERLMNERDEP